MNIFPAWIKDIFGNKDKVSTAVYQDKSVYVYSVTESYAIISYSGDGTKMFSVNTNELKNIK